jgi:hypothetical protein
MLEHDAEAKRRVFVRSVLADLRLFGVPTADWQGKSVGELLELRRLAAHQMMRAA